MLRKSRRSQRSTPKETLGKTFAARKTMPGKSFAAVLSGDPQHLQTEPAEMTAPLITLKTHVPCQSAHGFNATTSSLDDMF
jgi:hypothetical protein